MTTDLVPRFPEPLPSKTQSVQEFNASMFSTAGHLNIFCDALNEAADILSSLAANALLSANGSPSLVWVSGTTYVKGDVRWSPSDFLDYRRKTDGTGSIDPKDDPTNWILRTKTSFGGSDIHTSATDVTLTNMDPRFHVVSMTGPGLRVKLPPANTMQKGVGVFEMKNIGSYRFAVVRNDQTFLCFVYPGQTVSLNLSDASTVAGKWHVFGQNLQNIYDLNAPVQLLNGASDSFAVAKLSSTKSVIVYRKNSDGKLYAKTVNVGAAAGAETQIWTDTGITDVSIASTTATQIVITYRLSTNTIRSIVVDVSGDTFTAGGSVDCETGGSSSYKITKTTAASATKVLVHWIAGTGSNAYIYFRPITISGNTPTLGTLVTTTVQANGIDSVVKISATKFIISFPFGSTARQQMQSDSALTGSMTATSAYFDPNTSGLARTNLCLINNNVSILFVSVAGTLSSDRIAIVPIDTAGLTPVIGRVIFLRANIDWGAAKLSSALIDSNTIYLSWSGSTSAGVDGVMLQYTSDGDIRLGMLAERIDSSTSASDGSVINIPIDATTVLQFARKTTPELVYKTIRIADITDSSQIATTSASSIVIGGGGGGGGGTGEPGQSAYLYIMYADDALGNGFTDIAGSSNYIGLLQSTIPITPTKPMFDGKWKYWGGQPGSKILSGVVDPTTEGVAGDYYINKTTAVLFGPRTSDPATPWPGPGIQIGGDKGDSAGFKFKLGASVTEANPGNEWFRFNSATYSASTLTKMFMSAVSTPNINIADIIDNFIVGGTLMIQPATSSSQVVSLEIASITKNDAGAWYTIGVAFKGGTPLTPSTVAPVTEYVISYSPSVSTAQILDMGVLRYTSNKDAIDKDGLVVSGILSGTHAQMIALNPPMADREYFHVTDYGYNGWGIRYRKAGTDFIIDDNGVLHDLFAQRKFICPATQATAIANNGGKVQITAAAHQLTTAMAVDATNRVSIRINSWTGTGAAGIYSILTVDGVDTFTIDLNHNSAFGVPYLGLPGSLLLFPTTILVPPLNNASQLTFEVTPTYSAGGGEKKINTYLNDVLFNSAPQSNATYIFGLRNTGAKTSQESVLYEFFAGANDISDSDLIQLSQNTANQSVITFKAVINAPNEVCGFKRVRATLRG